MKYSVGCGLFGIYAGVLKPSGKEWKEKTDVTTEAISAVADYLFINQKEFHFAWKGEDKKYVLKVVEEE